MIQRCFATHSNPARIAGVTIVLALLVTGADAMIETAAHNQIETLTLCGQHEHCMTRIPGSDIDAVKEDLRDHKIDEVWTSISFTYPFIFETGEKLIASESIFGVDRPVYRPQLRKPEPSGKRSVFVIETNSPYRTEIESECTKKGGTPPRVSEHGKLVVIEQRFAREHNE